MVQHDATTRAAVLTALLTEIGADAILEVYNSADSVLATFEDVNFTQTGVNAVLDAPIVVNADLDGEVVRSRLYNQAKTRYQEIINPTSTQIQLSTFFLSAGVPVTLTGYTIGAPQ